MKKFTLTTVVLAVVLFLAGCVEVTFPEPMPFNRRDRSHFPKNIQGVWHEKGDVDNLADSIMIHSQYIDLGDEPLVLSDNSVLRKFNGYFVYSIKDDDDGRWGVYFAKHNNSVLSLYEFDGGNDAKIELWEKVLEESAIEKITKAGNSEKLKEVRLNPANNSDLRALINKGGLSHIGDYVR
jgi:hypothetical protein